MPDPLDFSAAAAEVLGQDRDPQEAAPVNPYADAAAQVLDSDRVRLKSAMHAARGVDPDARGRAMALAKAARVPVETAEQFPDEIASAVRREIDPDTLRRDHPDLAQWLSHADRAAIASDDLPALRQLDVAARALRGEDPTGILPPGYLFKGDRIIRPIGDGTQAETWDTLEDLGRDLRARGERGGVEEIDRKLAADRYQAEMGWAGNFVAGAGQSVMSTQRAVGTRTDADHAGEEVVEASQMNAPGWLGDVQRGIGGLVADVPLMLSGGAVVEAVAALSRLGQAQRAVSGLSKARTSPRYAGAQQQASAAAAKELTAAKAAATLTGRGLDAAKAAGASQPLAIREGLNEGEEHGAADGALAWLVESAVPGAFGRTGVERALVSGAAGDVAAQGWRGAVGRLLTDAGLEASEEAVTEFAHAVRERATGADPTALDPDKLWRRLTAAAAVGGVAGGGFSLPATIGEKFAQDGEEARRAEVYAERLDGMVDVLANSKTNGRAPEEVASMLETTLGQGGRHVFVDADAFRAAFEDPAAAAQALGVSQEYATALATGGQVQLPVSGLLQRAAQDEQFRTLIQQARRAPTATTATEAQEFTARAPDALRQLQSEARAATAGAAAATSDHDKQVAEIEQKLVARLDAVSPEHIDRGAIARQAKIVASAIGSLAKRSGKSPSDLFTLKLRGDTSRIMRGERFDLLDAMIERLRTGEVPTDRDASGPSLVDYLREKGLADKVLAGELRSLAESDRTRKPGQRNLIRDDGIDLDTAAQYAAEEGYIAEATPNALLAALDGEIRGDAPVFSEKRGGDPQAKATRESLDLLRDAIREAGVDLSASNKDIRTALDSVEERAGTTTQGQDAAVVSPKGTRLDVDALLRQWRKATGDRTPIGGMEAWESLVEQSAAVDKDRLTNEDAGAYDPAGEVPKVDAPRRAYDVPGQQSFLTPAGEVERAAARGDTEPLDDEALVKLLEGRGGSIGPGDRLTRLLSDYVEDRIPNVLPMAGAKVTCPHDAAGLLAVFRSPLAERTTWLLVGADGTVKRNGLWAVGTIDSATIAQGDELRALLDSVDIQPGDHMVWSHNHPSGNPSPSVADQIVYRKIAEQVEARGATFDGLVLNGDTFYHGVGVGRGEGRRGAYDGGKAFYRADPGAVLRNPEDITGWVKSLSMAPGTTLAIHVSPHLAVVGIEAWQVAPDFETINKSRTASAGAQTFIVTPDGSGYKTKSGPSRIFDVVETTAEGDFFSLRRGGHFLPAAENDPHDVIREVREGESELGQPGKDKDRRADIRFEKGAGLGRSYTVNLFRGADVSSFLHEAGGHMLLELFGDLAADANAPEDLKADWQRVLEWLGAKDLASITEEQHETWARGFERYLMEGKAPAGHLREAFARIKVWLVAIYKSLGNLKVELSPEIRGVFDRLVAAEESLNEAEAANGMDALLPPEAFPDMAGWTKYQEAAQAMRQGQRDRLEGELLEQYQARRQAEVAAQRAEVEQDVASEIDHMPVYQVMSALQRGQLPDGTRLPDEYQGMKLDKADLVAQWGEAVLGKLPGPGRKANAGPHVYAVEGGLPVDQVAKSWGFPSGDAMVEALIQADDRHSLIQATTDKRMAKLRPDPMEDLGERAQAALATDHRAELFRRELAALGTRTGKTPAPIEALRQVARDQIAETRVYDLAPDKFRIAAGKAARRAIDAVSRQQWDEAFRAKTQEALSMELYRAARDAKEAGEQGRAYLRTFDSTAKRAAIGKAAGGTWTVFAPDGTEVGTYGNQEDAREAWQQQPQGSTYRQTNSYMERIDDVLDGFQLRRASTLSLRRRDAFREWVGRQQDADEPIDIDPQVMSDLGTKNWNDLTVEEQHAVVDAVRNIEKQAQLKNRLLKSKRERDLGKARADLVGTIVKHQPKALPDGQFDDILTKAMGKAVGFFESHRKDSFLARRMDGDQDGGAAWDYLIRNRNEAAGEQETRSAKESEALSALFKAWGKGAGSFKQEIPGTKLRLTTEQRISLALNWGNKEGRQRVMAWLGRGGWTVGDAQAVLDSLDAADWNLVNGVVAQINAHWSDVAALEQTTKGIAPEKVAALPFVTKAGVQPGGYYPIKYDPKKSTKAGNLAELALAKEMQRAAGANAQTRRGHTKLRSMKVDDLALRFDFGVIGEHLSEVIHDLTHRELTLDQNRLLRDPEISQAIIGRYGRGALDQLVATATDIAVGDTPARHWAEKFAKAMRINNSAATFGYNATSALMNLTGFAQSMTRVDPRYMAQGVARLWRSPDAINNGFRFATEKSDLMRNRSKTMLREVADATRAVQVGGTLSKVQAAGFYPMMQVQRAVDTVTWLGAYEQALAKAEAAGEKGPEADAKAVAIADQTVIDTQGSGRIGDLAGIQRGGEISKILTAFYSYFSVAANLQGSAIRRVAKDPANAGKWGRLVTDTALAWALPAAMGSAIKSALQGDERDEEQRKSGAWREQVSYGMGMLVGLREASGLVEGHFGYSGPAGTRGLAALAKGVGEVFDGDLGKGDAKALSSLVGVFTGLPAVQINRLIDAAAEDAENGIEGKTLRRAVFGAVRQ